ncbi:MAG: c-type cytochrome [Balneolaceae bacterium]
MNKADLMRSLSGPLMILSVLAAFTVFSPLSEMFMFDGEGSLHNIENSAPEVKILQPEHKTTFSWNEQVRYEISVTDEEDGESRFGEIPPNEVLLEIEYLPDHQIVESENELIDEYEAKKEHRGLSLIRTSDCFTCHSDKEQLIGPSFSEIAERYEPDSEILQTLGEHITNGSSGTWGNTAMPPHPEISQDDAMQMTAYILNQGNNINNRVQTGLDGMFRIIEQPESTSPGVYILTASYTDHGIGGDFQFRKSGRHSVLLEIR